MANSDTYFPCFFVYVLRVCPKAGVNVDIMFYGIIKSTFRCSNLSAANRGEKWIFPQKNKRKK
jgi:hypothetical protein